MPECLVCLPPYNSPDTVPQVLPCGLTACETCLGHLPQKFPFFPGCTQLLKFSSIQGPASLPKNIDLLRLCDRAGDCERKTEEENHSDTTNGVEKPSNSKERKTQKQLLPDLWSDELYSKWKDWVLPAAAISLQDGGQGSSFTILWRISHLHIYNEMESVVSGYLITSSSFVIRDDGWCNCLWLLISAASVYGQPRN